MIGRPPLFLIALAVAGFSAVHVVLALTHAWKIEPGGLPEYLLALALMLLACAGSLRWPPAGLERLWAVGLTATTLTACLLVVSVLSVPQPSYAMWYPAMAAVPLGGVALRGYPRLGIAGALGVATVTMTWTGLYATGGVAEGVYRSVAPTAAVVVCAGVWAAARSSRAAVELAHAEQVAAGERAVTLQARAAERADRLADAARLATPVLTRLASGERVTRRLARECELLEAGLRDGLVARGLVDQPVAAAAWAARARGVRVTLLEGPSAGADTPAAQAVRSVVARTLEVLPGGTVIARLSPPQESPVTGAAAGLADGSVDGLTDGLAGTVVVRSPDAMSVAAALRGLPGVAVDVDEDGALVTVNGPAAEAQPPGATAAHSTSTVP